MSFDVSRHQRVTMNGIPGWCSLVAGLIVGNQIHVQFGNDPRWRGFTITRVEPGNMLEGEAYRKADEHG